MVKLHHIHTNDAKRMKLTLVKAGTTRSELMKYTSMNTEVNTVSSTATKSANVKAEVVKSTSVNPSTIESNLVNLSSVDALNKSLNTCSSNMSFRKNIKVFSKALTVNEVMLHFKLLHTQL